MIDIENFKAVHHILLKDISLNGLDEYGVEKIFSLYSARLGESQRSCDTVGTTTPHDREFAMCEAIKDFQSFRSSLRLLAELARDERKKFFEEGQLVAGTEVEILKGRHEGYTGFVRSSGNGNVGFEIVRDGRPVTVEVPFAHIALNRINNP